jgi:tRNA modification GTPase
VKQSILDTIAAIITPQGQGGIGVIRISGRQAHQTIQGLIEPQKELKPQQVELLYLIDTENKKSIERAMITYLKAPKTYTGEDVVEISCHGSMVLLERIMGLIIKSGARLAEPGEFTRRAFLNGKLDLTQAEAIIDLIQAKTELGGEVAFNQLDGKLKNIIKTIREKLVSMLSRIEGEIDFPDDFNTADGFDRQIEGILNELIQIIGTADQGRALREGVRVAIIGRPNVGKSSLLNALLKDSRAIVSHIPGTTRDTIEETISIKGVPFIFVDTAGVRSPGNEIEEEGIKRARQEIEKADLVLMVCDNATGIKEEDRALINSIKKDKIVVINKIDLPGRGGSLEEEFRAVKLSALTGEGIGQLENEAYLAKVRNSKISESFIAINERQKEALIKARKAIESSLELLAKNDNGKELVAIELKHAIQCLGEVSGEEITDEIIDQIFARFCVGK